MIFNEVTWCQRELHELGKKRCRELLTVSKAVKKLRFALFLFFVLISFFTHVHIHAHMYTFPHTEIYNPKFHAAINKSAESVKGRSFDNRIILVMRRIYFRTKT